MKIDYCCEDMLNKIFSGDLKIYTIPSDERRFTINDNCGGKISFSKWKYCPYCSQRVQIEEFISTKEIFDDSIVHYDDIMDNYKMLDDETIEDFYNGCLGD